MNHQHEAPSGDGRPDPAPIRDDAPDTPARPGVDELSVLNLLIRDTTALRQRLFSYLQFYLTAQAALAVLFGFIAHDSYDVLQMPGAKIGLVISTLGLFASFVVIGYGLLTLRPGKASCTWVSRQMERTNSFGDVAEWAEACQRRLEGLLLGNEQLITKVARIRIGLLIQLVCGLLVFTLALNF